jgi:hypothetical protein
MYFEGSVPCSQKPTIGLCLQDRRHQLISSRHVSTQNSLLFPVGFPGEKCFKPGCQSIYKLTLISGGLKMWTELDWLWMGLSCEVL